MAKFNWAEVTREDVLEAIRIFNSEHPDYPEPRSTFLVIDGHRYPAKHIRGMAYQVHFGQEVRKENYTGGQETVRFFERLGFETHYTHQSVNTHPFKKAPAEAPPKPAADLPINKESPEATQNRKVTIPSKGVIEQKNTLQLLLNQMLDGDVVCEKTFPWMRTPAEPTGEYAQLCNALCSYRGDTSFVKRSVSLRCDFVCESKKLIIEYDERQHFSEARRIALMSYPQIPLNYDRDLWLRACGDVQAKDNQPVNRDEIRAYYDSTRDIEAAKHGYRLIRIMHGQINFGSKDAAAVLAELISSEEESEEQSTNDTPCPQTRMKSRFFDNGQTYFTN